MRELEMVYPGASAISPRAGRGCRQPVPDDACIERSCVEAVMSSATLGSTLAVDPRLRVIGLQGLRATDASIMPAALNACTHAPTIMIGEKAAAMIAEDARRGAPEAPPYT